MHHLTYNRVNHAHLHMHGYREEGTVAPAFDMTVLNRFCLAPAVLDHLPQLADRPAHLRQWLED